MLIEPSSSSRLSFPLFLRAEKKRTGKKGNVCVRNKFILPIVSTHILPREYDTVQSNAVFTGIKYRYTRNLYFIFYSEMCIRETACS